MRKCAKTVRIGRDSNHRTSDKAHAPYWCSGISHRQQPVRPPPLYVLRRRSRVCRATHYQRQHPPAENCRGRLVCSAGDRRYKTCLPTASPAVHRCRSTGSIPTRPHLQRTETPVILHRVGPWHQRTSNSWSLSRRAGDWRHFLWSYSCYQGN
jgi:hypothetical protein